MKFRAKNGIWKNDREESLESTEQKAEMEEIMSFHYYVYKDSSVLYVGWIGMCLALKACSNDIVIFSAV